MVALVEISGFDIEWNQDGTLSFADDIIVEEAFSRPRGRLRSVALDPEACEPGDAPQYWMYNGVAREQDRATIAATGMRYELTLMPPCDIGREHAKTLGHWHSSPGDSTLNYPEAIEVLRGQACFVFQTMNVAERSASFIFVVGASAGDKLIIPPNLHHLTINAADEPLLFADVISFNVRGIYEPLAQMGGAAYMLTHDGWIANPRYASVCELQLWNLQSHPNFSLHNARPLYRQLVESPESLAWLARPERFAQEFPQVWKLIEDKAGGTRIDYEPIEPSERR